MLLEHHFLPFFNMILSVVLAGYHVDIVESIVSVDLVLFEARTRVDVLQFFFY